MKKFLRILSALGLASLPACDLINPQPCMYGTPSADYKVMGKVTDESGSPIEGIKVYSTKEPLNERTSTSNKDGNFEHSVKVVRDPFLMVFEDVDGDLNGGQFKSDTLEFKHEDFVKVKDGEGWYSGEFEIKEPITVKMKK